MIVRKTRFIPGILEETCGRQYEETDALPIYRLNPPFSRAMPTDVFAHRTSYPKRGSVWRVPGQTTRTIVLVST